MKHHPVNHEADIIDGRHVRVARVVLFANHGDLEPRDRERFPLGHGADVI